LTLRAGRAPNVAASVADGVIDAVIAATVCVHTHAVLLFGLGLLTTLCQLPQ
jgi:hypothetical protein